MDIPQQTVCVSLEGTRHRWIHWRFPRHQRRRSLWDRQHGLLACCWNSPWDYQPPTFCHERETGMVNRHWGHMHPLALQLAGCWWRYSGFRQLQVSAGNDNHGQSQCHL